MRHQYRRTQQNIDAIKRQLEANPDAFKKVEKPMTASAKSEAPEDLSQPPGTGVKSEAGEEPPAEEEQEPPSKRAPIDKQEAFLEFKTTDEGLRLDDKIAALRQTGKERRQ